MAKRKKNPPLPPVAVPLPHEIRAERERRKLTQTEAAKLIGISWRSWQNYELGRKPSGPAAILLRMFVDRKKIT